eukprot:CAMPEP_0115860956 /NCGR_PEP_ID=MMETSP0287-20121206/17399_1 /TAXON_ID=412157 /ORGANISM="Chrysochromulina rotalis, Strain UIO044" /LENGTH=116 /DNA_ID=CAMNT_0003315305 /DNA_START=322 /DNA_END=669 /DNA_ORIENTATION=-
MNQPQGGKSSPHRARQAGGRPTWGLRLTSVAATAAALPVLVLLQLGLREVLEQDGVRVQERIFEQGGRAQDAVAGRSVAVPGRVAAVIGREAVPGRPAEVPGRAPVAVPSAVAAVA